MTITFNAVIPKPLSEQTFANESVWGSDFEINSNEKIILNAVSGKGKSTFVSFLSGHRSDYEGEIKINQKSIKSFSPDDWAELRQTKISTVYQDLKLIENLTGFENLLVKNELTNHFEETKLNKLIERVGLKDHTKTTAQNLSYGQKQRFAILRALCQPFEILILDEPFSHLDLNNQKILIEIIEEELKLNNAGFLLTSLDNAHPITYNKELFL